MSVVRSFGAFVSDSAASTMAPGTAHHAARALLDWTGVALAGGRTEPVAALTSAVEDELGNGTAQVLSGNRGMAPARTAALLNGTSSHVAELDDIYSPGLYHPGSPTIAAALATCQKAGATGKTLLHAIAIGYQVGNAIAKAVQPAHYEFWHTTGTVGCFGAAAAAAVALGLTAEQTSHALATSATMAAGLQQAFRSDSMSKPLHAGRAAEAGVLAALCAAHGMTGEVAMLEGPVGFGRAMSKNVDWDAALRDLAGPWTVAESTHKAHACCGHTFAAIDGAMALREKIRGAEIVRIEIKTYRVAVEVAGIEHPTTPFEAKFSIPFAVATALASGHVELDAFSEARLRDRSLRLLMSRVELQPDDDFTRAYPAMRGASTTITLADGRTLHHHQSTRRGSPSYPLSDHELGIKFVHLARPVLGNDEAELLRKELTDMISAEHCGLRIGKSLGRE